MRPDAIVCATDDGHLARAIAHFRPACRIIVLTPSQRTRQQLALVWGVEAYYDEKALTYDAHALISHAQTLTSAKNIIAV